MSLCERCELMVDDSRPGYRTGKGRLVHETCPEVVGELVGIGGFAEVFEIDRIPRVVYVDAAEFDPRVETERDDLQDAIEDEYVRAISWGSWRLEPASWVVPTPSLYDGMVWVCRTDGWAPDDGLEE